jgi:hypothetical protein
MLLKGLMVNGRFHPLSKNKSIQFSLTNNPTAGIIFQKAMAMARPSDMQ